MSEDLATEVETTETTAEESGGPVMVLEAKKFAFQSVLEKAASVLPTRDVMPVLKNFLIEASAGKVRVVATDLELSVVAETEMVLVNTGGSAVFPGKRLLDIVKEAEEGDLRLTVEQGEATVEVNRSHWTIKLQEGEDYPPIPDDESLEFVPVKRSEVLDGLNAVRYAAARDGIRPTLMLIDVSEGRMRAADGVRFQQVDTPNLPDIQIPVNAVEDLVKLLRTTEAEEVEIGDAEDHLVFRVGSDSFLCNKMVAEFPDVDQVLLQPALANDMELHVDREELVAAVKRARITADEESNAIAIRLTKNAMEIAARDKFGNDSSVLLDCAWDGPDHEVGLNWRHLLEMLSMADVKSCHFYLGKDGKTRKSPILLRDEETGLLAVLNQVRLDWAAAGAA